MSAADHNDAARGKDGEARRRDVASSEEEELIEAVGEKEERKVRARRRRGTGLPVGLGVFGIVGWSVMVPTLLGLALGIWLDARLPGTFPWTVVGLLAGLALGCLNAWYWVSREQRDIGRGRDGRHGA